MFADEKHKIWQQQIYPIIFMIILYLNFQHLINLIENINSPAKAKTVRHRGVTSTRNRVE